MSGNEVKRVLYWDTCIYLAWLKGEDNGASVNEGIKEAVDENWDGKLLIVTSTITLIEVLESSLTDEQEVRFQQSFRKQLHVLRDVDPAVAVKARVFRGSFMAPGSKRLAVPDAIHLATAAIYKCDEFWTLDGGGKDKRHIGLLELNEDARIDGLKVKIPYPKNPALFKDVEGGKST